ncbi:MAG: hypothetical protein LC670_10910 [Flavobacteriales bacterium]|nr:hypothetical protein [Flavobacteriales bacterium]
MKTSLAFTLEYETYLSEGRAADLPFELRAYRKISGKNRLLSEVEKTTMKAPGILVFALPLFLALCGCSNDDEETPPALVFTETFRITLGGEVYEADEISAVFVSSPQSLSITGRFPQGGEAGLSMVPIPAVGEHSTDLDLSFSVEFQTESYFCNTNCTLEVIENNTAERRFDARISGVMVASGFSPDSLVLTNGRITVAY